MPPFDNLDAMFTQLIDISIPVTLYMSEEDKNISKLEYDSYFNGNKNIHSFKPYTIYNIIKDLSELEQIEFIKKNIDFIMLHDDEIFMYHMLAPKSLSYYLSYKVIKEIKNIDNTIFEKMINCELEHFFNKFEEIDYINFLDDIKDIIIKNPSFLISIIFYYNSLKYRNLVNFKELNKIIESDYESNKRFILLIQEKYGKEISLLDDSNLLSFTKEIKDSNTFKIFIENNIERFKRIFINESYLHNYLSDLTNDKQWYILSTFLDQMLVKNKIKTILHYITINNVIRLYKERKELFKDIILNDWVYLSNKNSKLNEFYKSMIDKYEIISISDFYKENIFTNNTPVIDVTNNKWVVKPNETFIYLEKKFRVSIKPDGKLCDINENTFIFSNEYLKNLKELHVLFKSNLITKDSSIYKKHLLVFIIFLKSGNIVNEINDERFGVIDKYFYRIIMGECITPLFHVSSIKDMALLNRLRKIIFKGDYFTIEQIERFNVKELKSLISMCSVDKTNMLNLNTLVLKLMLLVGYNNAKKILLIDNSITTLEHLVGSSYTSNIKLDKSGNPILDKELIDLLFVKEFNKISNSFTDKNSDIYKYFPRIINEWNIIKMSNCKSLNDIIDYLKSDNIVLSPIYYRLEGLFKYIGCSNVVVEDTIHIHDEIIKRNTSTIPTISGVVNDYTYEILDLHDMNMLTVGNKTNCCFTIRGTSSSSLKHACLSENGRILVIKKNGELIAHSWLWRNGNLLCLDNIEISKSIDKVTFLDVYVEFAKRIVEESYKYEGLDCIKNVTVGFTNFDKPILGIDKYKCLVSNKCDLKHKDFDKKIGNDRIYLDELPQPIENVNYTDSKNVQYLLNYNSKFELGQSKYRYIRNRDDILYYNCNDIYNNEIKERIIKIINSLRYRKYQINNRLENYKRIDISSIKKVYCNVDWYKIMYINGEVDEFILNDNEDVLNEYNLVDLNSKSLIKV